MIESYGKYFLVREGVSSVALNRRCEEVDDAQRLETGKVKSRAINRGGQVGELPWAQDKGGHEEASFLLSHFFFGHFTVGGPV